MMMACVVQICALVDNTGAEDVYRTISSFEQYSQYTDAVRDITIYDDSGNVSDSRWSVNFRGGILEWTERDVFDRQNMRIQYDQLSGDFDEMRGEWLVRSVGDAVEVNFTAIFDMGIPTLAPIINPVAMRALRDNMHRILKGLLGDDIVLTGDCTDLDQTSEKSYLLSPSAKARPA
jgi:ribosome-associated toxin RatA of RatAB toxin-antitoxin module